jgi:hypothetical protein
MMLKRKLWLGAIVVGASLVASTAIAEEKPATAASPSAPAATAAEIGQWLEQLNDDRYQVREEATRHLLDAGAASLDQLQAAADADRPEPADRSLWILRRLASANEPALKRQALEHLAALKKRPQIASAARTILVTLQHQEAVEALEQLGANYNENQIMLQPGVAGALGTLDLDSRWRGKDADLIHLRHLNGLRIVRIVGTNISVDALINELPHCETLQTVWLYGTKLTPDDVAKLRKALTEQVEIDYRKGALLGVSSATLNGEGPPLVRAVSAGSAAAVAGIQAGDLIQKFNGENLTTFKALTQKIANYQPGNEVNLTILRGGQQIEFKVKLGQWKDLGEQ